MLLEYIDTAIEIYEFFSCFDLNHILRKEFSIE
jgi:hypothetical protein